MLPLEGMEIFPFLMVANILHCTKRAWRKPRISQWRLLKKQGYYWLDLRVIEYLIVRGVALLTAHCFYFQIQRTAVWILEGVFEVRISNGWSMGYVLCTTPTNQIPDQYIRKADGNHLSGIQMVGLSSILVAFENQNIWHPTSFQPFVYQTSSVFRSPLYLPLEVFT